MLTSYLLIVVLLSALATYIWRGLGVKLASKINSDSEVFEWLGCVAYAMLAGLMARVMILPVGVLAETSLSDRSLALAAGFAVFFLTRRHFFAATAVATALFYILVRF